MCGAHVAMSDPSSCPLPEEDTALLMRLSYAVRSGHTLDSWDATHLQLAVYERQKQLEAWLKCMDDIKYPADRSEPFKFMWEK